MSCIFHLFLWFIDPLVSRGFDLKHLKHGFWQRIEVSSSHNKGLSFNDSNLDSLKVVGKVEGGLN